MRILSSLLLAIFVLACTRYGAAPPTAPPKETLPPLPISRVVFQEGPFGRITLRAVRWTSDGRYFVVGTEMELQIRDGQSGALRARVVADIDGYVLSSDGRLIVVALEGGDLLLIDVAQGTTRRVQAPEKDLGCTRSGEEGCLLEISADGTRLVVPTRREALLWDLPQGRLLQKLPLENGRGFIRISGGNVLIETAKTTRRFDLKSGADRGIAPVDRNVPKAKSQGEEQLDSALLALNDDAYRDVTWAPGDDAWAVASDRRLALWGRQGPMKVIPFDPKRLSSFGHTLVTWSRDGSRVAVGCIGVFFVFKAPEGTLLHQIEGSGAMAPDGTRVALFRDNALIMVDIKSGKEQAVGGRADYPPRTLSPEGDRLQLGRSALGKRAPEIDGARQIPCRHHLLDILDDEIDDRTLRKAEHVA